MSKEEVREEIALRIRQNTEYKVSLRDSKTIMPEEIADFILSIKVYGEVTIGDLVERGLLKCDNQELPRLTAGQGTEHRDYCLWAQQDMLKAGFVKCERKEK